MKRTQKLYKYLDDLKSHIPKYLEVNTKVAKNRICWDIDHSLKVINKCD